MTLHPASNQSSPTADRLAAITEEPVLGHDSIVLVPPETKYVMDILREEFNRCLPRIPHEVYDSYPFFPDFIMSIKIML